MGSLIVDDRDQRFVLYEMLKAEEICKTPMYANLSRDVFEMVLTEAEKYSTTVLFPTLVEGDRVGCRLENGEVKVPPCYHRAFQLYRDGGWNTMSVSQEAGGQGFPLVISMAAKEWFLHNFGMICYPSLAEGAAHLIEVYGTPEQKSTYMAKMVSGEWGGTMGLTEPGAGSDLGRMKTKAVRRPDGTFRIQGTKQFITGADQDMVANIIHPVLARIEGDPAGTAGISIFLVPKFLVNEDGSLGRRNDYTITAIEKKMGVNGSATCVMNLGDNGNCYAELLGEERQGMKVMFQMMNEFPMGVGIQSLSLGGMAYLHALKYAKERLQGSSLMEMKNPDAPQVPIIEHADIRRMLLWMKAHMEGMRALVYYASYCIDRERALESETDRAKNLGILELLTPVCKAYCSDTAFKITELAIQIHGGYGYCTEYPLEQFMRDIKIASIYEGANGIQALDLVGRKLAMKNGRYFMLLVEEMNATIKACHGSAAIKDLAEDVRQAVDTPVEMTMYFAGSVQSGKFMIPIGNAYPFLIMMGKVIMAWLLLWEAGVAREALDGICAGKGLDQSDTAEINNLAKQHPNTAFYVGKLASARYFIKHVLPEVDAAAKAIKS